MAVFGGRNTLGTLVVIVVALVAGGAGYLTAGERNPADKQKSQSLTIRGTVQTLTGDELTMATADGVASVRLASGAKIETLRPSRLDQVVRGDWVNAGAVGHAQTLFALTALIVIPESLVERPER